MGLDILYLLSVHRIVGVAPKIFRHRDLNVVVIAQSVRFWVVVDVRGTN